MTGVGEIITPLIRFRQRYAVLVNPGVPLGTAAVFREFDARLDRGLRGCRNDLTAAAKRVAPKIAEVLDALEAQPRIMTVRMSGSGPTCFGLFPSADTADYACQAIAASYPAWWCRRAVLM
jgi:4-diphosphocytidyl-2-C-methyl-D-erythritol kinase